MTTYRTLPASSLTEEMWSVWSDIQSSDAVPDNPYLCADFTRSVARVRTDVEVVLFEDCGRPVGFFPFQREGRKAHSVSGRLSESHGAVVLNGTEWSALEMFRAAGLTSWHFDHLPASQKELARFAWGTKPCPEIDLTDGYEVYRKAARKTGGSFKQTERKARKMEREVGPLRFEWHSSDATALRDLVKWKSEQHRLTGVLQIFKRPWVAQMLEALTSVESPDFHAPLSTLHAGDQLVAVHIGPCSRTVLSLWFPTYNPDFEKYSPGLILLLKMAEAAAARGVCRLELGPGNEQYKQQFKTGDHPVLEGMLAQSHVRAATRRAWYQTKKRIRASRFSHQLESPFRATRLLRQWLHFR
jgi:CelD/BcsL family acetyltransferase involved in cellulose biosynthesis